MKILVRGQPEEQTGRWRHESDQVPVSQFKLFDSTEHSLQVALLIFQHQSGQSLKHQGHVEHQHCVTGSHVTGLDVHTPEIGFNPIIL